MITTVEKPEIVSVLRDEGIELVRKGRNYWTLCPLHTEDTASFKVDPERQSFYCFGCHEHGDVIAFVMKHRGIAFKDALRLLGISEGGLYKPNLGQKKKRDLLSNFRCWCQEYYAYLCKWYLWLQTKKAMVTEEADIPWLFYHAESVWQYRMDILLGHDDKAKFELYEEVTDGRI
jgi:hypothetical protein